MDLTRALEGECTHITSVGRDINFPKMNWSKSIFASLEAPRPEPWIPYEGDHGDSIDDRD